MKLLAVLKTSLEAEGIEIAFPQRVIWRGDRETIADREGTLPEGL
jgi:small-conductance mechanosensitive channel